MSHFSSGSDDVSAGPNLGIHDRRPNLLVLLPLVLVAHSAF